MSDLVELAGLLFACWVSGFGFGYLVYSFKRLSDFL